MQFEFCTCTHGERCPGCSNEEPEPTIKVSELKSWCEDKILALELEEELVHYDYGLIFAYKDILPKFCKEARSK
jgi:hypothetical protein